MGFGQAVSQVFAKYAEGNGRAAQAEFWWFYLFTLLVDAACVILDAVAGARGTAGALAGLALFLPSLTVGIRRLHDTDRSGWWTLLTLLPVIGWIVLLVWWCQRGTEGPNRFGDDPLPRDQAPARG